MNESKMQTIQWSTLPNDIKERIFTYLGPKSFKNLQTADKDASTFYQDYFERQRKTICKDIDDYSRALEDHNYPYLLSNLNRFLKAVNSATPLDLRGFWYSSQHSVERFVNESLTSCSLQNSDEIDERFFKLYRLLIVCKLEGFDVPLYSKIGALLYTSSKISDINKGIRSIQKIRNSWEPHEWEGLVSFLETTLVHVRSNYNYLQLKDNRKEVNEIVTAMRVDLTMQKVQESIGNIFLE